MIYQILDDHNAVVNTIKADQAFMESNYPGKFRLVEDVIIQDTKKTQFSKLEFQLLFTFEELVLIEIAAETDPGIRVLQRQQNVADFTDVQNEQTQLGIMYLVSKGLLTHERGLQILGLAE